MNINDFIKFVDFFVENKIPPGLLKDLNMGVHVNPKFQEDEDEDDYYILGEYIQDVLGNQIVLYYGSFKYLLGDASSDMWQKEIVDTIKHELTHHIEAMAGQEDLANQEAYESIQRNQIKQKKRK